MRTFGRSEPRGAAKKLSPNCGNIRIAGVGVPGRCSQKHRCFPRLYHDSLAASEAITSLYPTNLALVSYPLLLLQILFIFNGTTLFTMPSLSNLLHFRKRSPQQTMPELPLSSSPTSYATELPATDSQSVFSEKRSFRSSTDASSEYPSFSYCQYPDETFRPHFTRRQGKG